MTVKYKQLSTGTSENTLGINPNMIFRQDFDIDGNVACEVFIPTDPMNGDYRAYLEWVAQGNTIEPPDPLPRA